MRRVAAAWAHLGELAFNMVITHVPVRHLRLGFLRLLGVRIGPNSAVFRGTTVLGASGIRIGRGTNIGFRCLLDGRAGLTIGDHAVIASDTHFLAGHHDIHSAGFDPILQPIVVGDHTWLASRVTVQSGVTIGRGAVVAACALVTRDVETRHVVAGVPAKTVDVRQGELSYEPAWHPIGY